MSLDPPVFVVSLQNNIRSRPIPWEGAVRAKTISEAHLKKIKAIDKVRRELRKRTLESETEEYVALFLGRQDEPGILQTAAKRQDIVLYLLVLLEDLIEESPLLMDALLKSRDPYAPFIPFLKQSSGPDDGLPLIAALVLTKLLSEAVTSSSRSSTTLDSAIASLYSYLSQLSKSTDAGYQDIAAQSYSALLRTSRTRVLFWEQHKETVTPLIDILRAGAGAGDTVSSLWSDGETAPKINVEAGIAGGVGIQLMYRVLLVFWQLSFEGELVGEGLQDEHDLIILYVRLLRISPKEKITRVLLSTFYNLLTTNRDSLLPAAALARLPAILKNVKSRHLSDADLLEDLDKLIDMLDEYTKTQTTFDEYAAEVRHGHLRWSPPHRNQIFWAENARRILNENKSELPHLLCEIISKPWDNDKQVLAIGCNDIACLVKEVPEKRPFLEKLGLKARVMELMKDPNEQVRWESLRAVGEWLRYSFD